MVAAADVLLLIWALAVLVPTLVVLVGCLAALLPERQEPSVSSGVRPSVGILIPAHDEQAVIGATLASVVGQMRPGDRIVVVADNCIDGTAAVATQPGVTVLERTDPAHRGKGYALDFGLRHMEPDPPAVVVVIDADCHVHEGTIHRLACQAASKNRPVQATSILLPPDRPASRDVLSSLAYTVKGAGRARGMSRLGLPCLLGGTGMAFPWEQIRAAPVASGNIVEDMKLGVDLAMAGHPPCYCPAARVTGRLPQARQASISQRTRWEHGHLRTMLSQVPRLVWAAVLRRRPALLALALELGVPPLSLLVVLLGLSTVVFAVAAISNASAWPLALVSSAWLWLGASVLACWYKFARGFIPLSSLLMAPSYALLKVPLYLRFVVKPQRSWIRTERDQAGTTDVDNSRLPAESVPSRPDTAASHT